MDLTPTEQVAPAGDAAAASQASVPDAAGLPPALTKQAYDAAPSLADAFRKLVKPAPDISTTQPGLEQTSATPEPPAADALPVDPGQGQPTTPGASTEVRAEEPPAPELSEPAKRPSRKERREARLRALQEAQQAGSPPPPASPEDEDDDFLASEIERVVKPVADQLAQLAQNVTTTPAPVPAYVERLNAQYVERFGDDEEFRRRSDIKINNSGTLTLEEDDELAQWANNRLVRDLQNQKIQRDVTAVALGVATQRGIDAALVTQAPSLAHVLESFWQAGQQAGQTQTVTQATAAQQATLQELQQKAAQFEQQIQTLTDEKTALQQTNRQLSDELEAFQQRAPAFARQPVVGGLSSVSALPNGTIPLDPSHQSGRQMLAAAARNRARQSRGVGPVARNR